MRRNVCAPRWIAGCVTRLTRGRQPMTIGGIGFRTTDSRQSDATRVLEAIHAESHSHGQLSHSKSISPQRTRRAQRN